MPGFGSSADSEVQLYYKSTFSRRGLCLLELAKHGKLNIYCRVIFILLAILWP